jgi:hypothetical protein
VSHAFKTVLFDETFRSNGLTAHYAHSKASDRYITQIRSNMARCHLDMREPPLQPVLWSPPNERNFKSPGYPNTRDQPSHPQAHQHVGATSCNYPPPHHMDDAPEAPILGDHWPQHIGSTFTSAAPTRIQYIDYDYTQHPHDRLNIHLSAPPPHLQPASAASSSTQPVSPRPTVKPGQNTHNLPGNKTNLEKMRHERELVFQKAATELDQARCDTGSIAPTNKAWEDAWEVLRENVTKM